MAGLTTVWEARMVWLGAKPILHIISVYYNNNNNKKTNKIINIIISV